MFCVHCGAANPDEGKFCHACGKPLASPADPRTSKDLNFAPTEPGLAVGATLAGRYRIVRQLGQGGMGRVYLAEDRELGAQVALKVLRDVLSQDEGAVQRLKDEAKLAMTLSHDRIVRVNHFEASGPVKFLVMEYVEGETLAARLARERRLPEAEARRIGIALCEALGYSHERGVLHRDVKPANVLLGKDSSIKLADFGIARVGRDSLSRLTGHFTSGTLIYMAPEQVRGARGDARSDLYSLGVLLYELVGGDPPFHRGDVPHQILHETPQPLSCALGMDEVSEEFHVLLIRLLAKAPEGRPTDARSVRAVLDRTVASSTVAQDKARSYGGERSGGVGLAGSRRLRASGQKNRARPAFFSSNATVFACVFGLGNTLAVGAVQAAQWLIGMGFWGTDGLSVLHTPFSSGLMGAGLSSLACAMALKLWSSRIRRPGRAITAAALLMLLAPAIEPQFYRWHLYARLHPEWMDLVPDSWYLAALVTLSAVLGTVMVAAAAGYANGVVCRLAAAYGGWTFVTAAFTNWLYNQTSHWSRSGGPGILPMNSAHAYMVLVLVLSSASLGAVVGYVLGDRPRPSRSD